MCFERCFKREQTRNKSKRTPSPGCGGSVKEPCAGESSKLDSETQFAFKEDGGHGSCNRSETKEVARGTLLTVEGSEFKAPVQGTDEGQNQGTIAELKVFDVVKKSNGGLGVDLASTLL